MKKLISFAINDYPGAQNDLQGCVNDQKNIIAHLGSDFGFEAKYFKNSQVTKQVFRDEVTKLIMFAKSGDIIVIHYSGHGTQLIDKNAEEYDGYDEALYLFDGAFPDDEFTTILLGIVPGVRCIFIMDCCFSGTITRIIDQKAKFKPLFSEVDSDGFPIKRKQRKLEITNLNDSEMNHLVLTGCSDKETSADALINGSFNGALTYAAMKFLDSGITYKEWHRKLLDWLKDKNYSQTPQLEGPDWMKEESVFGSILIKKECFLKRWFGKKTQKPIEPPLPPNPDPTKK